MQACQTPLQLLSILQQLAEAGTRQFEPVCNMPSLAYLDLRANIYLR